ncbi:MAG: GntR family transcriptional regulator [Coriobacteriia bacterium]|nr:GntR family transcriptional regulator [Coriobacteriia bacterium]
MIVEVDSRSSVPIYQQLKTALIAGILSGEIVEGERLRSVRDLAQDLGINLHTVRKVYTILADEGYIEMTRNKGAIVVTPPKLDKESMSQFEKVLLPIVIELRAHDIGKEQYSELMERLWDESIS